MRKLTATILTLCFLVSTFRLAQAQEPAPSPAEIDRRVESLLSLVVPLDARALSYYDATAKQWRAEPGDFEVLVGRSSERIELRGKLTLSAAIASVGLNVMAHHGWADFDRSKKVEISGIVVESKYENPHCFVRLKVEQGEWAVELSAVPRMKRYGITAEMIKPGTPVTLVGHPHKKKVQEMKATQMILDGKRYDLTR